MIVQLKKDSILPANNPDDLVPRYNEKYIVYAITFPDGNELVSARHWALVGSWQRAQFMLVVNRLHDGKKLSDYLMPFDTNEFNIIDSTVPDDWVVDKMGEFQEGVLFVGYEGMRDAEHIERYIDGEESDVARFNKTKLKYERLWADLLK